MTETPASDSPLEPAIPAAPKGWIRRTLAYWIPETSERPRRPDGLLSDPGPDRMALLVAFLIAVVAAVSFEQFASIAPVPPGGDNGTWILLSYPYVGLPYPSQAAPFTYPPFSFPFLGLSVVLAGGPLAGGRLFSAVVIAAMGLGLYSLGRSMFRLRTVALIIEAAFFVQPDFQQLYYFGSYPNMVGFIFFFLSISYALRFLRSRRPLHLAIFWTATAAAVLSHALVGVFLLGLLAIVWFVLLLYRRLPREMFTTRAGILGALGFAVSTGAYYLGAALGHVGSPNYLSNGSLAQSNSVTLLPSVLRPLYLQSIAKMANGTGFTMTSDLAIQIVLGSVLVTVGLIVVFRWLAPSYLSHRTLMLAAWLLSVFGVALACYYLGLGADYRRFAYFLYPLSLLTVGIAGDMLFVQLLSVPPDPIPAGAKWTLPPRTRRTRELSWRRWDRRQSVYAIAVTLLSVGLVVAADNFTIVNAQRYASYFSGTGHDASFVHAMKAISDTGIAGSIFSTSEAVDRWPSTLTQRNVFEVRAPTGFTYADNLIVTDELAFLALNYRYTVTNGLVGAAIPGITPGYFNASPVYGLFAYGVFRQVLQVAPGGVSVTLAGGASTSIYPKTSTELPEILLPSDPSSESLVIVYNGSGFVVTETIAATPGTDHLSVAYAAVATGPANVTQMTMKVVSATSNYDQVNQTSPNGFAWVTNTTGGNYSTFGNATTNAAIRSFSTSNASTGRGAFVTFGANSSSTSGSPTLTLGIDLTSPGALNPTTAVAGFYSGPTLFSQWEVRFALLWNGTRTQGPIAQAFFQDEYHATLLDVDGAWTVLVMPAVWPR